MFVYMNIELHWYVIIMMHLKLLVTIRVSHSIMNSHNRERKKEIEDEIIFNLKAYFILQTYKSTLVQILYHIKNIHFFNWVSNISNRERCLSHLITGLWFLFFLEWYWYMIDPFTLNYFFDHIQKMNLFVKEISELIFSNTID